MSDLTPEKLAELRHLLDDAPPLPYRAFPRAHGDPSGGPTYVALEAQLEGRWEEVATADYDRWSDMGLALAAAAINAMPALLAAADELAHMTEARDNARAEVERLTANPRDEYHTMDELYEYRMLYNVLAANAMPDRAVKSWRHSDGELCFGGGWFVVYLNLPTGQVSNHYKAEHWELFRIPEAPSAPEYDGHTPAIAADSIRPTLGDDLLDSTESALAHMREARDNARAEVERLTATVERVRKLADRIGRHTEVESDPAQVRDADTGVWCEASDAIRAALDATPETGGESA